MADNALLDFFDSTVELLDDIVNARPRNILFSERFRQNLAAAWDEAQDNNRIVAIRREIGKLQDSDLEDVGLAGAQLRLKYDEFFASLEAFKLLGGVKRLKRVLDWINLILGSLTSVVGIAEILKEIKEAIRAGNERRMTCAILN